MLSPGETRGALTSRIDTILPAVAERRGPGVQVESSTTHVARLQVPEGACTHPGTHDALSAIVLGGRIESPDVKEKLEKEAHFPPMRMRIADRIKALKSS
ncbi:MAG: hypothetical protein JWO36_6546 [Myxococcales bacterium]|nr:hypothetical protein [Myxococcales bacterium]